MKVTQSDIARISKVDRTTVSKVLSGYQINQFSDEIIKRVQDTALGLGYKSRKFKSSLDICFVFPDYSANMNLYSYPQRTLETILGIGDCISGTNNRLHIVKYSGDFKDAAVMGDAFLIWELSGDNKLQKILTESGKEFIVLNRAGKSYKGSCVIHDYEYSCQKSVDVLLDAGHSKIAFLGETPTGVSLDESKVLEEYINKKGAFFSQEDFLCFRDDSPEQIKGVAETVLKRNYSAIIASNDMKGYKIINELGKSGISVPDDISVIGNHRVDTPFDIPVDLTSFITPWGAMGKRGAELLLSRSKLGEGFSRSVVREIIEPVFYEGKSVRSLS